MSEQLSAARCAGCGGELEPKARGRARKWCSERCRKRSYDLECVDCGGRVDGTTPGKMANRDEPRCLSCSWEHQRKWTPEAIVAAIQRWAREKGEPPRAPEWLRPSRGSEYPPVGTVQKVFGSWNAGIAAAGLEPRPIGCYGRAGEDPAEIQRTVELYRSGLSLRGVSKVLGNVGSEGVRGRLVAAGEPRRPASVKGTREARRAM